MCLARPMTEEERAKWDKKPASGVYHGWKSFGGYSVGKKNVVLYPFHFTTNGRFPLRTWVHEKDYRSRGSYLKRRNTIDAGREFPRRRYKKGFHIYLKRPDEIRGIHKRVLFREPVAWGWQCGLPIVVAKEMFIGSREGVK